MNKFIGLHSLSTKETGTIHSIFNDPLPKIELIVSKTPKDQCFDWSRNNDGLQNTSSRKIQSFRSQHARN